MHICNKHGLWSQTSLSLNPMALPTVRVVSESPDQAKPALSHL